MFLLKHKMQVDMTMPAPSSSSTWISSCILLSQVGMSFFCQQSTVSSFCARWWVNMLFTKLFMSKAAVKKVPTRHSCFCTYWLCWFLLSAHGSALAWGILFAADWLETAWAWRKTFSMASPTLQLEGQGKHTKEFSFPLIFFGPYVHQLEMAFV